MTQYTNKPPNPKKRLTLRVQVQSTGITPTYYTDTNYGIFFPYQPYPEQIKILRQMHLAFKTNSNAIIESPTGTGKTLCLLVGALSFFYLTKLPSKIYYFTRTHSQISQVVNELKKTPYKCKVTIMGSRDSMCVNSPLRLLKGKVLDKQCAEFCAKDMCKYYRKQQAGENYGKNIDLPTLNMQELRERGIKEGFCPYYLSKQKQEESEVVILTYNYFLNYNIFQRNNFEIQDSVVIFDQAHNVDKISQDGCSTEIGEDLLQKAINCLKEQIRGFEVYSHAKKEKQAKDMEKVFSFCRMIENLKRRMIADTEKKTKQREEDKVKIFSGFQSFIQYLNDAMEAQSSDLFPKGITRRTLRGFCDIGQGIVESIKHNMNYIYLQELVSSLTDIASIMCNQSLRKQEKIFQVSIVRTDNFSKILFLCLSASFIFNKIVDKKPKSIILASGTLKPLNYWDQEIGLEFPIKLSTDSFITKQHLYSQLVTQYKGKSFDFSYCKRDGKQQIQNLLTFIADVCTKVSNGIIVAFSCYQVMEFALQNLNHEKFKYKVYWESKGSNTDKLIEQYSHDAKTSGAVLFMVMRGKFAEGFDFYDYLCRAMIIVGIPFLPISDPKIQAKKRFMIENTSKSKSKPQIGFDRWYMIQAARAVNQTIGRVIRHNKDYGCVFLVDRKYSNSGSIMSYLPEWLGKGMRPTFSFYQINKFLKNEGKQEKEEEEYTGTGFYSAGKLLITYDKPENQYTDSSTKQPKRTPSPQTKTKPRSDPNQDFKASGPEQITIKRERKTVLTSELEKKKSPMQAQQISQQSDSYQIIQVPITRSKVFPEKQAMKKKEISQIKFKKYAP